MCIEKKLITTVQAIEVISGITNNHTSNTKYIFSSCVPENNCGRVNNKLTIKGSDFLALKVALAENSQCPEPLHLCCHEDDVIALNTIDDPGNLKCDDIDGYT